jgi:hypothetical protein
VVAPSDRRQVAATQGTHVTLNIDRHTFNLTADDDTAKALGRFAVKAPLTRSSKNSVVAKRTADRTAKINDAISEAIDSPDHDCD